VVAIFSVVVTGLVPGMLTVGEVKVPVVALGRVPGLMVMVPANVPPLASGLRVAMKLVLSPALMVTDGGATVIVKSVTGTGPKLGNDWNCPLLNERLMPVRVTDWVPVVGVRTMLTETFPFTATVPTGQVTTPWLAFGQVPPGEAVAELNWIPLKGNEVVNVTREAGSGPMFMKLKTKVT
jgi:hypothetical protein